MEYLFYTDASGKRRLRPFVRYALLLTVPTTLALIALSFLLGREPETPDVEAVVVAAPTPKPATPAPTVQAAVPSCGLPATWKMKAVLTNNPDEDGKELTVYGLDPLCAYDTLYKTHLARMLALRGYTIEETKQMMNLSSFLGDIMDPYEIETYPPYNRWPQEITVLGVDGYPRPVEVTYGRYGDWRAWHNVAMYAAPNYCYKPPAGTRVPLREKEAMIVCVVETLSIPTQDKSVVHIGDIDDWTFVVDERPHVKMQYLFIDNLGNAYLVAARPIERSINEAAQEIENLAAMHGLPGVWFFGEEPSTGHPVAKVVDWRNQANRWGIPTEMYPLPEGWENAPRFEDVPEVQTYAFSMMKEGQARSGKQWKPNE